MASGVLLVISLTTHGNWFSIFVTTLSVSIQNRYEIKWKKFFLHVTTTDLENYIVWLTHVCVICLIGTTIGDGTVGLNLERPLYLGGVDPLETINPNAGTFDGFVGCIGEVFPCSFDICCNISLIQPDSNAD